MHLLLFLLLVLLNFSWGLKQLESTTLTFDRTDANHSILKAPVITIKPECQNKCGDLTIPYPFGINSACSIKPTFVISCNDTTDPPKAFLMEGNVQVLDISNTELRITNYMAYRCYDQFGNIIDRRSSENTLGSTSYMYSAANVFTIVGCDDFTSVFNNRSSIYRKGCMTTCSNTEEVTRNQCSGSGCCQVSVNLDKYFRISLSSDFNHTYGVSSFNPCGYAFLGERGTFMFRGPSDLNDPTFMNRTKANVPVVLDWVIENKSCTEAVKDLDSYACKDTNSSCINDIQSRGYLCSCNKGYEGNPYLSSGCHDIDECKQKNDCEQVCFNTEDGKYGCSCNRGYYIDKNNFGRCIPKSSKSQVIMYALGIGFFCLLVIIGMNWLYCIMKQRKHFQIREKFFEQNGGLLLRQQSISEGGSVESTKHFTYEELKKATNNYAADRIVGQGGYGIVYKGILPDHRIVAVKRSKVLDTSQVDQFINEVVILAQINHRNVVKLLGCCLECEVPVLVYEFISNGTLHHHVHSIEGGLSWLSLDNRLRIAAESSGALAYLHSAASMPIMHRDVKLANILLDDNCVSKISDFGASRQKRLFQILDRRVVREGAMDQLEKAAQLVRRCLNFNGEDRPTMKEVTMEIESLRRLSKHPWTEQHGNEDTLSLKEHPDIHHSDLYEIQLSSYHNVVNDFEQYSSGTISLLHPPSSPR
ncbi:putative wall-associated receptor kinase-like protein 16 [Heracleum sosnowskyi]|uniref:Wall-associated receptor kinase-like protein 16 n=1 Tax=Heracleum sosnowskyi TaxID=360622 RepID=A0AAD8M148_9APIA|nr:putative wall-associated receptor kinase-like protein 16 [Heracleum sosnowskyi]